MSRAKTKKATKRGATKTSSKKRIVKCKVSPHQSFVVTRDGSKVCVNGYPILSANGKRSVTDGALRKAVIAAAESR